MGVFGKGNRIGGIKQILEETSKRHDPPYPDECRGSSQPEKLISRWYVAERLYPSVGGGQFVLSGGTNSALLEINCSTVTRSVAESRFSVRIYVYGFRLRTKHQTIGDAIISKTPLWERCIWVTIIMTIFWYHLLD